MTRPPAPSLTPLCQAALGYARRGWPVFPCNPKNKKPLVAAEKAVNPRNGKLEAVKGTGGVSKATRDEEQIKAWWKKWPQAMIGAAMGHNGLFAVDFDPRVEDVIDEATGEVLGTREWTLEQLKAETEDKIGCALPETLAVRTPSGGVHIYFRQPDGDPINNRGNLPKHVDVRGIGGYVILPPSKIIDPDDGVSPGEYRWLRGSWDAEIAEAPAGLITVLRERKKAPEKTAMPRSAGPPQAGHQLDDAAADAVRKYALSALMGECQAVRTAGSGARNAQLNESGLKIASLVAAGALDEGVARAALDAAAHDNPGRDDDRQLAATIDSGWSAGINNPRDLGEVAAAARERAARGAGRGPSRARSPSSPPAPLSTANGKPSSQSGGPGDDVGGRGRGGEQDAGLTRECALLPQTDLGNLERFLRRHGDDFLYVEAWGWLAWDGKRWNRDMAVPLLGRAVQRTMRAIQDEAAFIRHSGVPMPPEGGFPVDDDDDDDDDADMFRRSATAKAERKRKTLLWWQQRKLARQAAHDGPRHDAIAQIKSNGDIVLLSDKIAAWGRTSEAAGHIGCIAKLAEARLAEMTGNFDTNPLLLNLQSGTLEFLRPDEGFKASVREREHRREDRMTKIGSVSYDPAARCPRFDAFLETVQPDPDMRRFLDTWGGYNSLGLADAQKMALFYGEGSNGKGVWVNTLAHILGDYAWSTGIETFIDAGRTRKGSDASPDLAALAGRRMVYANEPEDHSKFADGLIKSLTSDEPKGGVRELMKPPFELQITFTNTVMANTLPKISTDHGIQRRVQVVPWGVIIPDAQQDLRLKDKLKEEAAGILNRMVEGALRYLDEGLTLPKAIKEATRTYQQDNDLLGRFLDLCVARVEGEVMKARPFHRVFAAWQTWAGLLPASGKPWSEKYLSTQMEKKGFKKGKSSSMQWEGVAVRYAELDFVTIDDRGNIHARDDDLPAPKRFPGEDGAPDPAPAPPPDDYIGGWDEPV